MRIDGKTLIALCRGVQHYNIIMLVPACGIGCHEDVEVAESSNEEQGHGYHVRVVRPRVVCSELGWHSADRPQGGDYVEHAVQVPQRDEQERGCHCSSVDDIFRQQVFPVDHRGSLHVFSK